MKIDATVKRLQDDHKRADDQSGGAHSAHLLYWYISTMSRFSGRVQKGKELNDLQRNPLDIKILSNLRFGSLEIRDTSVTTVTNKYSRKRLCRLRCLIFPSPSFLSLVACEIQVYETFSF